MTPVFYWRETATVAWIIESNDKNNTFQSDKSEKHKISQWFWTLLKSLYHPIEFCEIYWRLTTSYTKTHLQQTLQSKSIVAKPVSALPCAGAIWDSVSRETLSASAGECGVDSLTDAIRLRRREMYPLCSGRIASDLHHLLVGSRIFHPGSTPILCIWNFLTRICEFDICTSNCWQSCCCRMP